MLIDNSTHTSSNLPPKSWRLLRRRKITTYRILTTAYLDRSRAPLNGEYPYVVTLRPYIPRTSAKSRNPLVFPIRTAYLEADRPLINNCGRLLPKFLVRLYPNVGTYRGLSIYLISFPNVPENSGTIENLFDIWLQLSGLFAKEGVLSRLISFDDRNFRCNFSMLLVLMNFCV